MRREFILILIFFLSLSSSVTYTNTQNLLFNSYSRLIYPLLLLDLLIVGVMYMLAKTKGDGELLATAKSELWQFVLTLAIFLLAATIYMSLDAIFRQILLHRLGEASVNNPLQNSYSTAPYLVSIYHNMETEFITYLKSTSKKEEELIFNGAISEPTMFLYVDPSSMLKAELSSLVYCALTVLNYPVCVINSAIDNAFFIVFVGSATYPAYYYNKVAADVLDAVFVRGASIMENYLIPWRIIFSFFFGNLLSLAPFAAVFLRLLPWTRDAGNLLFTLVIAFGIVFPFVIAYLYISVGITPSSPSPVKSFVTSSNICETSFKTAVNNQLFPALRCNSRGSTPGLATSIAFYSLAIAVPSLALGIASTFAVGFNKLFDYFNV